VLHENDENNQEANEDAVSNRKVLRCDLKVQRLGIKSRFETELELDEDNS